MKFSCSNLEIWLHRSAVRSKKKRHVNETVRQWAQINSESVCDSVFDWSRNMRRLTRKLAAQCRQIRAPWIIDGERNFIRWPSRVCDGHRRWCRISHVGPQRDRLHNVIGIYFILPFNCHWLFGTTSRMTYTYGTGTWKDIECVREIRKWNRGS